MIAKMTNNTPTYKTAIHKTRRKDTRLKWKDAMWYQHYFPDGTHGVRFLSTVKILRGDKYEILRKGQEE